jgi:OmcA/MtrC family decaheme c-type cytochrome
MSFMHLGMIALSAAAAAVPSHGPTRVVRPPAQPSDHPAVYSSHQMEAYLTPQQIEYVRPGFNITVVSVTVPADRRPVVELTFTDDLGQPLDRAGILTPGAISASFVLAWYDAANRDYVAYTTRPQTSPITGVTAVQASTDSGGSWTQLELGHYRYRFGTVLPADYDASKTTTLGVYGERNLEDIIEKTYYDNALKDVRPDGGDITEQWDMIATSSCNHCHDPLSAHGGSRREVKLCVLCHNNTQSLDPDTGNVVNFKVMIHKIHYGPNLPSVQAGTPYEIIGYRQAVNDFSDTTFPQDIRNCTTCHTTGLAQSDTWYDEPSRAACGSCHDNINWVTGEGHLAGPQLDDSLCNRCHIPQGTEFDISVMGAHTIPTKSDQLAGLSLQIMDVSDTAPGEMPTVTFKLTNNAGDFVDPSSLSTFMFLVGGPTVDYQQYFREDGRPADCNGDTCTYTFTNAIPADAAGTWTLTADYYRNVVIDNHTDSGLSVREAGFNPIFYFVVTDAQPMPRREVVELSNCDKCHDVLALHGGQRFNTQECVICHNPTATDADERPADAMPARGIHLKWLVHHIHTGENLTRTFTVYGHGGTPHNYNDVTYPGDRRDCEACHKAGTEELPLPDGVLPTTTPSDFVPQWGPDAAACLSCHDTRDAAAHAYQNTAPFGESCVACHGQGREFAVDKVHAR